MIEPDRDGDRDGDGDEQGRALVDELRRRAAGPSADSFQLMGEDLVLVTGPALEAAAADYQRRLAALPAALRPRFEAEQRALADQARDWLVKYNRNVHSRLAGYLQLGFRCRFAYPWPVVAMLGICQVMGGMVRSRVYGLLGAALERLGVERLGIERVAVLTEAADDVLRRTNRGIFADSVPTVLYGLRAHELVASGDPLGRALIEGPLPPVMDDDSRAIIEGLVAGLSQSDPARRFAALSDLTLRHFAREQAIFSHHMGAERQGRPARARGLAHKMTAVRAVPAPVVRHGREGGARGWRARGGGARGWRGGAGREARLQFQSYRLPDDFDMRDHAQRVREFGRAYVTAVTATVADYLVAVDYVVTRFDRHHRPPVTDYDPA